jgi:hypothetical protein
MQITQKGFILLAAAACYIFLKYDFSIQSRR